jgi:capsular exopolysaccharide synthesis family protein
MAQRETLRNEEQEVGLLQAMSSYTRYWYVFVLSLVVCIGLAYAYLYCATAKYKISSSILLKNEESEGTTSMQTSAVGDMGFLATKQRIDNEIEVLKAKSLMQRVFEELGLNATYYVDGRLQKKEIYGSELPIRLSITKLHPTAYDKMIAIKRKTSTTFELTDDNGERSTHNYGEEVSKPYGIFTVIAAPDNRTAETIYVLFHDIVKLAHLYNENIKIEAVNKKASVVTISLIDSVPQKGKDIIDKLLEVYIKEALEDRRLVARTTISFIDDRLKYLTREITDVEKNVEQFKAANEVTDVTANADQYITQQTESNRQLSDLQIQLDVVESIESYIVKQPGKFEMVPSNLTIQDPTLVQLVAKFNELQLERERMLRTTLPSNPLVQDLNEQLGSLQLNILENLHNIKSSLLVTQKRLQSSSGRFRSQIQKVPSIERNLLEISRQQGIKGDLYLYLLQKREESALTLEVTVPRTRTLDPAIESDKPISPKPALVYLFAAIIGFGIPFSGVYLKEALNDKIESKRDIKRLTETPLLGEISHSTAGRSLVVTEDMGSSIAEMFRLVRSNLQFATAGKENKVIMVTSNSSGEGKTFFSINLAASLTLVGKKVALLELDLRMPSLSKQLGRAPGTGISDYLVGAKRISIEDIIRPHTVVPGLYVASAGSLPPNPAELMASPNLAYLINSLKASFDHVIIDTAPIGKVADAFSLGPLIDSTVYLVRAGYTAKNSVELVDEIYLNHKLPHPMILINDVKISAQQSYGYGYNYGTKKKRKKDNREVSIS